MNKKTSAIATPSLVECACDLRFVIGLFLCTIGLIVLGSYLFGPDDRVQGVHVNLIGAALLIGVGFPLGASAFLGWRPGASRTIPIGTAGERSGDSKTPRGALRQSHDHAEARIEANLGIPTAVRRTT